MINKEPLKLTLITSGFDHVTASFHLLPEKPSAIVEIDEWTAVQRLKRFVRKVLRVFAKNSFPDCEKYCRKHKIQYRRLQYNERVKLGQLLSSLSTNLLITYKCPVIPMDALNGLSHGGINLHDSYLPNYRGGSPLFWQVVNNEATIGCTVHYLSKDFDGGDILEQVEIERPNGWHHADICHLVNFGQGVPLLVKSIADIANGTVMAKKQLCTGEEKKAPNCNWREWRKILSERRMTTRHIHSIDCFIGDAVTPRTQPPVI